MAERVRLNNDDLQDVVGGAFNFYAKDNNGMCYIDGVGTYYCSPEASSWVVTKMTKAGTSPSDVVAEAVQQGLFWK